jgi:hypothetical protein
MTDQRDLIVTIEVVERAALPWHVAGGELPSTQPEPARPTWGAVSTGFVIPLVGTSRPTNPTGSMCNQIVAIELEVTTVRRCHLLMAAGACPVVPSAVSDLASHGRP